MNINLPFEIGQEVYVVSKEGRWSFLKGRVNSVEISEKHLTVLVSGFRYYLEEIFPSIETALEKIKKELEAL